MSDTSLPAMPNNGITALGEHPATPNAVTAETAQERAAANKQTALATLSQFETSIDGLLADLPPVQGDDAISAARSLLAFCKTRCAHEARAIKGE